MKKRTKLHRAYDLAISTLAFAAAVLVVIDATQNLNAWEHTIFIIIWAVFLLDVIVRYIRAKNKKKFLRINYWDIVAVIPFHGLLPDIPIDTLDTVLSIIGLVRVVAFLLRPLRKLHKFYNTNGFKYVLFATFMTIITGGILIHYAEGMDYDDGIWWAFVTATTVGYGDISPATVYGRLIAMVLMLVGIGLIGSVTSTLTSFFLNRQKKSTSRPVIAAVKEELDRFDELTAEEVERLCDVLIAMKKDKKRPK